MEAHIVSDADMHAHNTFETPEIVTEKDFAGCEAAPHGLTVTLPCNSVVEIRVAR